MIVFSFLSLLASSKKVQN